MPTYEYACDNHHRFSETQPFTDDPVDSCPECGAPARRLFSPPRIVLKGGGWAGTRSR